MTDTARPQGDLDSSPNARGPVRPGPILHVGGTHTLAVIANDQLLELREQGWDIHVACAEEDWAAKLHADGFPVHPIGLPHRPSPLEALAGGRDLARLLARGRFRLVHTHNAHSGVIGRSLARLFGLPSVHTWRYSPLDAVSSAPVRLALGLAEGLASRAGQRVLFENDEDMRFAIDRRLVPPRRAVLMGSGIHFERWSEREDRARLRARLGIEPEAEVVCCVARLVERKGQPYLLEAVARLARDRPGLQLLLVGDGPEEGALRSLAAQLAVASRVTFTGHREDVPELLAASDVVCLPSRREGAPRVVMEAMISGVPVVATDVVGTRTLIEHEVTGLLVPYAEPLPLATALDRALSDAGLRARVTERARSKIERDWRVESVGERISAEYVRLLADARR